MKFEVTKQVAASVTTGSPHPGDVHDEFAGMRDWLDENCTDPFTTSFDDQEFAVVSAIMGDGLSPKYPGYMSGIPYTMTVEFEHEADAVLFRLKWMDR